MFGRPLPTQFVARAGLGAPPARVLIDGLEVSQAIQDMQHTVPLVAGKRTVARAYASIESASPMMVRGELAVTRPGSTVVTISSINSVTIDPAINGQLRTKREDISLSLNFLLPDTLAVTGPLQVQMNKVTDVSTGVDLVIGGTPPVLSLQFVQGYPLRVRILGLRYSDGQSPTTFEPTSLDYELIESWLGRAYPVPNVIFSRVVVNSNNTWPFDADQTNAQIAAIRRLDMASGGDERTHYFGLVADAGTTHFMRGKAAGIPQSPDPSTVASGPTGSFNWGWDFDGSYGDWYTGHELGHTFGRFHPGFCNGNSPDDPHFPYPNGQISSANGEFVGLDMGDTAHGISIAALPGVTWHDIMTYCDKQWLSAYTYMGIRSRIAAEDQMTPPAGGGGVPAGAVAAPPQAGAPPSPTAVSGTPQLAQGKFLNVIATVNLTKQTGKIQHVHPIESAQLGRAEATSSTRVRLLDASGSPLRDEPVELRLGSCPMPGEDQTGLVDAILPFDPGIQVVELLLNGQVIDTFAASPVQPAISNVRAGAAARPGHVALAWDVHHAPASTVSYSVQVSTNEGRTWQTVAVRQPTPTAEINLEQFRPAKKVHVRVIASDGFNTQMTSQQEIQME